MIKIERIHFETFRVNGKIVTIDSGKIVNDYDLTFEEKKALERYKMSLDRIKEIPTAKPVYCFYCHREIKAGKTRIYQNGHYSCLDCFHFKKS